MSAKLLAGLFGGPARTRRPIEPDHRTGHELPGAVGAPERHLRRGGLAISGPGTTETRLGEALLFGLPVRR